MTSVSSIVAPASDPPAAAAIVDDNSDLFEDSEFSLADSERSEGSGFLAHPEDAADSAYSAPAQTVLATVPLGGRVADLAAESERGHVYVGAGCAPRPSQTHRQKPLNSFTRTAQRSGATFQR